MDLNALAAIGSAAWGARFPRLRTASRSRRTITALLLLLLGAEFCGSAFAAGHATGIGLAGLDPVATGRILWRVPLLLALAGALWDGGCVLDPAPCRPYFVSLGTRVLAEAMLGVTTPIKGVLAGFGLVFSLGLAWGQPRLLPMGLAYVLLALVWTACLERVIHALVPAGLLPQRGMLVVALGLGAALIGLAWLGGKPLAPPLQPGLERLWARPGADLVRFWQTGQFRWLRLPLAATLVLLAGTGICVARELDQDRRPGASLDGGRIWRFQRPWAGVARLQLHQLLASRAGQMRLLMLLMSVLLVKEPELETVGVLKTPHAWTGIAAGITFGAILVVPLCNLLGFDRGGVQTWFRAPLAGRDLLLGKILGVAGYAALAGPILLALVVQSQAWHLVQSRTEHGIRLHLLPATDPMRAGAVLALAGLLVALFLWWAGSGLELSVRRPWPMTLGSYGMQLEFDEDKLARLGVLLAPVAWMGPLFGLSLLLGQGAALAGVAVLVAAAATRFRRCLARASLQLVEQREQITLSLSA
jgi:hypothetical protein